MARAKLGLANGRLRGDTLPEDVGALETEAGGSVA